MSFQVVIDTNVLVAALRSELGTSFRLISLIGESPKFEINVSVPLILEYEEAANRSYDVTGLSSKDVSDVIDYVCSVANKRRVHFLWRPVLRDPKDDMILELAVEAQCDYIITFNLRDFAGIEKFGLQAMTPQEFLRKIGERK